MNFNSSVLIGHPVQGATPKMQWVHDRAEHTACYSDVTANDCRNIFIVFILKKEVHVKWGKILTHPKPVDMLTTTLRSKKKKRKHHTLSQTLRGTQLYTTMLHFLPARTLRTSHVKHNWYGSMWKHWVLQGIYNEQNLHILQLWCTRHFSKDKKITESYNFQCSIQFNCLWSLQNASATYHCKWRDWLTRWAISRSFKIVRFFTH